ncbi:hypothetical protein [Terracoccus luteus]|uniref:Uncharacterized protein n=1 Tax=Terracoccus luteus TaxID=53356 RepID=A0A495XT97_9MICO|nr:hypothetical protein [Terracoccus luteus]MBB2987098.1 hypothetical protein [Terracoccus luteus]MCP2172749.1 hypothetical protein [Terracoccus luteus]RKT77142.1 hypothetical protein DFJ68_0558 [Terracoccus luteus]
MRFPLLLVLVIVVLGVLWYVMSGRSVSRRSAPSRHEPVLPSQRSDHGLNVPLTSAGGGLAAQSASEPSFGGAHTPIDEDRPATVSWDRDARDEDELMTDEPGQEPGGDRVAPPAESVGPGGGATPGAAHAEVGDRYTVDEPEGAASMTDEPAGAEAAAGAAAATRASTPRVDGGDSDDDPVEAEGDHPLR